MKRLTIFFLFFVLTSTAQQVVVNTLYLKSDNIPDRLVKLLPVKENCSIDSQSVLRLVMEGKLSEKKVRLNLTMNYKKGLTKIRTDDDGDLSPDQKMEIEVFGSNPAVDKTTYAIEDEKDEASVTITSYDAASRKLTGNLVVKYWDSAINMRRLNASFKFELLLSK